MDIQKILVPVDYSDDSYQALLWGASLAEKYSARLLLLHVIAAAVDEVYPQGARSMSPAPYCYEGMAPKRSPAMHRARSSRFASESRWHPEA